MPKVLIAFNEPGSKSKTINYAFGSQAEKTKESNGSELEAINLPRSAVVILLIGCKCYCYSYKTGRLNMQAVIEKRLL